MHSRKQQECPLCGPGCVGGAHRNALAEEGVETREQLEARQAEQVKKEQKHKVPVRPTILRHTISGAHYFREAEGVAAEYIFALEALVGEYRKSGRHHQGCADLTQWSFDGKDHRCSACAKADALLAQREPGSR